MPRKSPNKAKSPEVIAAEKLAARVRDFAAVNLPPDAAALAAHNDVRVTHAERDKEDGARREDAFLALRDGMQTGAYDAARRLEKDITTRRGEHDHGRPVERVDGDQIAAFNRNDAIIAAGERVDAVLARIGKRDAWLLQELITPGVERSRTIVGLKGARRLSMGGTAGWRAIVAYITGEENPVAQGAAVRAACANLADAYEVVDEIERRLAA